MPPALDTRILPADDPQAIQVSLQLLNAGGLVAFPTDTVYGLGALAFDGPAIESIYRAKDRPVEKAIPVLLGDIADVDQVALELEPRARRLAQRFWPGPLTLVVLKRPELPVAVSADKTVGVRVPDHAVARSLLRSAGPMAVTSANLSGRESPRTAQAVFEQLSGRIALVLDGGETPGGVPSTVVDCTAAELHLLRAGPLPLDEIRRNYD